MATFTIILLLIHLIGLSENTSTEDSSKLDGRQISNCYTPERQPGICTAKAYCNILQRNPYLSTTLCYYNGFLPIICCPFFSIFEPRVVNPVTPPIDHSTSSPPEFKNEEGCGMKKTRLERQNSDVLPHTQLPNQNGSNPILFVVGGNVSPPHSWPWAIAIFIKPYSSETIGCGGALINQKYVLTAAHCVVDADKQRKPSELFVKAGAHNLLNSGTDFQVSKVIVHQGYKSSVAYHDIALLKLSVDITYNDIIKPICLPVGRLAYQDFEGRLATVVGWGDTSYGGTSSDILQEIKLPIVNFRDCNIAYQQILRQNLPYGITDRLICAGYKEGGKDACQGDSGGPLMLQDQNTGSWLLGGVVSFGYQCARPNTPGVYTRVSSYMNWISANAI